MRCVAVAIIVVQHTSSIAIYPTLQLCSLPVLRTLRCFKALAIISFQCLVLTSLCPAVILRYLVSYSNFKRSIESCRSLYSVCLTAFCTKHSCCNPIYHILRRQAGWRVQHLLHAINSVCSQLYNSDRYHDVRLWISKKFYFYLLPQFSALSHRFVVRVQEIEVERGSVWLLPTSLSHSLIRLL